MARVASWPTDEKPPLLLVPLDGSRDAASGLGLALRVARACGGTITALYVSKPGTLLRRKRVPPCALEEFAEGHAEEADEAKLVMLPAGVWSRSAAVKTELLAARGRPADEILAAADARAVTLICMGTHGKSASSGGRLLGSVSREVFTRSSRPTFVVPPRAVIEPDAIARDIGRESEGLPIGPKVIAALDGGPGSFEVAKEAAELARRTRGSLRIFSGAPTWRGADLAPILQAAQKAAEAEGVPFKVDTGAPDASAGLVALSEQEPSSIVVLGTRAAPSHTYDHLGSFTDRLLSQIACPVEVLHLASGP